MSGRRTFLAVLAVALIGACVVLFVRTPSPEDGTERLPRFSSYFMQPEFVNDAFSAVGSVSYRRDVTMVLVNHHLIASNFIARIMKFIATDEPCTVVIISPDHFAAGAAPVAGAAATGAIARTASGIRARGPARPVPIPI